MIGWLQGTVVAQQGNTVIINVSGVGYEVSVPVAMLEELIQGNMVTLYIHSVLREDGNFLYGFSSLIQRQMFRELIRVSGVGPKMALLILSGFSVENLMQIVHEQNSSALITLPGIGKKTAERLLIELKDRIGSQFSIATSIGDVARIKNSVTQEATEALIALEIKPTEAYRLVDAVMKKEPEQKDIALVIKKALAMKLQREI